MSNIREQLKKSSVQRTIAWSAAGLFLIIFVWWGSGQIEKLNNVVEEMEQDNIENDIALVQRVEEACERDNIFNQRLREMAVQLRIDAAQSLIDTLSELGNPVPPENAQIFLDNTRESAEETVSTIQDRDCDAAVAQAEAQIETQEDGEQ